MRDPRSATLKRTIGKSDKSTLVNYALGNAPSNISFHDRDRNYISVSAWLVRSEVPETADGLPGAISSRADFADVDPFGGCELSHP